MKRKKEEDEYCILDIDGVLTYDGYEKHEAMHIDENKVELLAEIKRDRFKNCINIKLARAIRKWIICPSKDILPSNKDFRKIWFINQ